MDEVAVRQMLEYVDESVIYHSQDTEHMKNFLGFLSKLRSSASVANKILIYGYEPNATDVRTAEDWNLLGVRVLHPERVIHNVKRLEGNKRGYEDRILYDITATDGVGKPFMQYGDVGLFTERVLLYPPCPIWFLENAASGKGKAEYNQEEQVIEVTNGFSSELEVSHLILRESAHHFLREKLETDTKRYNRRAHAIDAFSVAYAICLRFGVQPPKLDNIQPAGGLKASDLLEIFSALDYAIEKVSDQIERGPDLKRIAENRRRMEQRLGSEKKKEDARQEEPKVDLGEPPKLPEMWR